MKIHVGYDLVYQCVQPTPMIFMLNVHPSRAADLLTADRMRLTPPRSINAYVDAFGNKCWRRPVNFVSPATLSSPTAAVPIRSIPERKNMRSPTCLMTRWCFCSLAATARPTA